MTNVTASKLLTIVNTLEGMIQEINAKQKFLRTKMHECKTRNEMEVVKNATVVLASEVDNINVTIDLIEDLHSHLATAA